MRGCVVQTPIGPARAFALALLLLLSTRASAAAQAAMPELQVRALLAGAGLVSADQTGRLGYDAFGLLAGAQLGYAILPWLAPHVAVLGAGFPSSVGRTGG